MDSLELVAVESETVTHPCVRCGACCSFYRVLFDPAEIEDEKYKVPKDLTEKVDKDNRAMLGTNQEKPRCVALGGHIGKSVGCTIYANRPSCCRNFAPSYEEGVHNPGCDRARKSKGMKALKPSDWVRYKQLLR